MTQSLSLLLLPFSRRLHSSRVRTVLNSSSAFPRLDVLSDILVVSSFNPFQRASPTPGRFIYRVRAA